MYLYTELMRSILYQEIAHKRHLIYRRHNWKMQRKNKEALFGLEKLTESRNIRRRFCR